MSTSLEAIMASLKMDGAGGHEEPLQANCSDKTVGLDCAAKEAE